MITENDMIQKIKDDLYLTTKQKVMDKLPDNQNVLFIGKFRVPTIKHIKIIESMLKEYNKVVVCIVKAKKENKLALPLDLQTEMLKSIFGDDIYIITHSTGNITSIINKSPKRINYLVTGSDRTSSYESQLKRHKNLKIINIKRDDDISSTNLINNIQQNLNIDKLLHPRLLSFENTIKEYIL